MSDPIQDNELEAILGRCKAASPAPWVSYIEGRDHTSGDSFIQVAGGERDDIYLFGATLADQDFIAHARQDIPRLIEEIRRLQGLRGK